MEIRYKPQVVKQLKRLSKKEKTKIINKLEILADDPLAGKPLRGELKGLRSLRVWPFRIVYEVFDGIIIVYSVARLAIVYIKLK
ncbi:type II toxin-antitoxin system mRNA interferase toxin, RelE/StbE family [Candidatus Woesebacteria bacterium]|nr:type II toxin-antitoxin system mRNA interferase toxin, RelE/StbE family [Candidatus Woesebacteria bacterium]QQG47458.1 MAG: type II toxin-antitoxin system mRNA interferase toxin, RelE/StbE family [Candidatus Woesebacteria bacterium]